MRIIYGVIILVILIFIIINSYKKTKDIFSPLCLFSFLQFLKYVPHMFFTNVESFVNLDAESLFMTFIVEVFFVLTVFVFYNVFKDTKKTFSKKTKIDIPFYLIVAIFIIGFLSRIYILNQLGGIVYIINNMGRAYHELTNIGNGYITNLGYLMTIAIVMCVYKFSFTNQKRYFIISIIFTFVGMFTYLVYSSRSPALEMLMVMIIAYHYFVKKISLKSIFKPVNLFIIVIVLSIIVILPSFRQETLGNSSIDYGNFSFNFNLFNIFEEVANEFSVVGRDTFVYNYFNMDNFWFGANYFNLLVALVPSSIYTNKPCIDDGNYLCNLIYGYSCGPNDGRDDLTVKYSMPFSSQSISYANFGILGVFIGAIILGYLYKKVYSNLLHNPTVFSVILYQLIVYQFELTTLGIMQAIIPLVLCVVVWFITLKLSTKSYEYICNIA